jgi:hypothetical protein
MADHILILECSDEELLALKEAADILPLSEELRNKIKEAINDAELDG